ncbi:MAG: glycosyltransferase family 39 protein [Tannerella sp.]|jgi:hypothetical protein|nr:glycosyltransferase family 39 protein [Tannerella sp.]
MKRIETSKGYSGLSLLLLATITLLVYSPVLWNDFLYYWDDQWVAINYFTEAGWTWNNLWRIFTEYYHGQYSPANELLYVLVYSIFGYSPSAFHSASLLLHVANVCLVFLCCRELLKANGKVKEERVTMISFIAALLFAVNPMNVESIAWISASKVLVYTFFYLLATYSYLQYLDRKKIGYYILTMFLFLWSFLGKEQAVTFPIWLLMILVLYKRNLKQWRPWLEVMPFLLLSLWFGFVTMLSQADFGGGFLSVQETYPLWQRIVLACYSLVEYATKFFIPYNLLYIYPFPMRVGEALPDWMLVYPALVLIFSAAFWKYLSRGVLAVGLTFFVIHIAVALHIIPLSRFSVIADRYIYLASIGLAFIVSSYFVKLIMAVQGTVRKSLIVAGLIIALFLGAYSNMRCHDWKNTDTIKKEIRELLKQRDDYIPPEQFEKMMEEDNIEEVSNNIDPKGISLVLNKGQEDDLIKVYKKPIQ